MKAVDLDVPIVNDWTPTRAIEFEVSAPEFRETWRSASAKLKPYLGRSCDLVLRLLECLLQVTKQDLAASINSSSFPPLDRLLKQLLGAIYSEHFFYGTITIRRKLAYALLRARATIATDVGAKLTWSIQIGINSQPQLDQLAALFDQLELDSEKVTAWQGWPCRTKENVVFQAPLLPIYRLLGPTFTAQLYQICLIEAATKRKPTLFGVVALSRFIEVENPTASVDTLHDPDFTTHFFSRLYEFYLEDSYRNRGNFVSGIVLRWRSLIKRFFVERVFPSGLIAEPSGGFPNPRSLSNSMPETNVAVNEIGVAYHDKLLTPIPLELTDDQALQFIFCQIRADADRIKQWAWTEVERMAALLERRHVLAAHGGVRVVGARAKEGVGADKVMFSTEWDHPDHLENGAATFEHYGYPCSADVSVYDFNALFPCPRGRWVEELAVPRSGALTPHCAILVSEHPAITPSFLENFELFDKQGKVKGILSTDTGQIIAGVKLRRGADLAAQEIFLTARSAFAFDQILRLTQPLRDHLRARNDDNWRYLLLASGRAFAYPTRIKNLSGLTSNPWPVARLEESFVRALGCSPDEAGHFVRKFSLSSLRASMGVIVYLDTRSVEQMAKALGQVKYEPQLLERYLPKVIREFFLERWIRIFQTGIIVEALKDSEYLLEATDFTSMDELDEFLRNHALKVPPQSQSLAEAQPQDPWAIGDLDVPQEVVFGLNERILTLLLSLEKAGSSSERALNPKAKYWAEMTTALIPYVRSTAVRREDIRAYLASAETLAHPALVERFAYAQ